MLYYQVTSKQSTCSKYNLTYTLGADDLKGKLLQQRTLGKKNGESDILMNLFILARQAEHEMKNGDPIVSS